MARSLAAALLGALFVRIENSSATPMVALRLFRERVFTGGLIALSLWAFGLFGIYFFTSLYLQGVLGFSPPKAGAAFVPMALLMAVGAVISERVSHRLGAHRVVSVALVLMGLGIASVSLLGADASFGSLMPAFALIGISGGFTVPLTASVLDAMPSAEAGVASGVFNASREVAGLLGHHRHRRGADRTRQSALLSDGATSVDAFLGGYRAGLLVAAGLVMLGGVAAFVGLRAARRTGAASGPDAADVNAAGGAPAELVAATAD